MALKILEVQPRSQAAKAGIKARDTILGINGMPVDDFFDLQYYANDFRLGFELCDNRGESRSVLVERQANKPLGIEAEPYKHKTCQNRCIFCFIDQMPPGLRTSLYVKDDDYLLSYAFGNYITLTNLSRNELKRIRDQHISPLYISVHTTDPELHRSMMGHKAACKIMNILKELSDSGISLHIQIVCVPGYNSGEELRRTLNGLLNSSLSLLSIGIVPVGLTRFRDKLPQLNPFDAALARQTLDIIAEVRRRSEIIQAADEFFVQAGAPIPDLEYYGDFPQLENGIGMLRLLLSNFQKRKRSFIKELDKAGSAYLMLTSRSASATIQGLADSVNSRFTRSSVRVQTLRNDFFGEQISVSGLLTARDILEQIKARPDETVVLSSNLFNTDGLTLDGVSQIDLKEQLKRPLLVVEQLFEDWDWI